jgi:ankyrin repeat protein
LQTINALFEASELDIGAPDKAGDTALHLACSPIKIEICQALIKHGANLYANNKCMAKPIDSVHRAKHKTLLVSTAQGMTQ